MFPGLLFIVFRFFAASLGSNRRGSTRWNLCRPRCPQLIQKGRQSNSWRVYQARRPCWYLAMRSRFLSNVGGVFISCRGWVHQIGIEVVQILGKVVGSENSGAPRHDGPVQQIKFPETCLVLPAGWVCELVAPLEFGPHWHYDIRCGRSQTNNCLNFHCFSNNYGSVENESSPGLYNLLLVWWGCREFNKRLLVKTNLILGNRRCDGKLLEFMKIL